MFNLDLRLMDVVTRWSTVRTLHRQDLAQHSYYVTIYTDQIVEWLDNKMETPTGIDRAKLLRYALWHDVPETSSGDPPGPYKRLTQNRVEAARVDKQIMKRKFPGWADEHTPPGVMEHEIVKLAEAMDEACYMALELRSGNHHIGRVYDDCVSRVKGAVYVLFKDTGPVNAHLEPILRDMCLAAISRHADGEYGYVLDIDNK